MVILVQGLEDIRYKNTAGRDVSGVMVYGMVTEEDEERPNLVGNRTFEQFFSGKSSSQFSTGAEYELKFVIRKFKGEYHAFPDDLILVD